MAMASLVMSESLKENSGEFVPLESGLGDVEAILERTVVDVVKGREFESQLS